jgi:hypothetical protein
MEELLMFLCTMTRAIKDLGETMEDAVEELLSNLDDEVED